MKIQSLSVVVPNKKCLNACKFCVSCMREEAYKNSLYENTRFFDLYLNDYLKRLEFARDNGCNTVMLTGNSEPQQNIGFLKDFGMMMRLLNKPFRNIEIQTTGIMIDDKYLRFMRNHVGVNVLSLSLSSFDNDVNFNYNGTLPQLKVDIAHLCSEVKRYDFTLRLSLNLTDSFDHFSDNPVELFHYAQCLGADQVTLRVLYSSEEGNTPQDIWITEHGCHPVLIDNLHNYIKEQGRAMEQLEFGATRYDVQGMSVVLDNDCMNREAKETLKYLILRQDCKLYSKWDTPASLIF